MPSRLPPDLANAVDTLFDAALLGGQWATGLDSLASAMGAAGAALIPQAPERVSVALPVSHRLTDVIGAYVAGGWHLVDPRSERGFKRIAAGGAYVTDAILFTPEERRRLTCFGDFYGPMGLPGFVGISFFAQDQYWSLTMLRGAHQPDFDDTEVRNYLPIVPYLRRVVTMAARTSDAANAQLLKVAAVLGHNAILIDERGMALAVSEQAEALLGDGLSLRRGRLEADEPSANAMLQALLRRAATAGSPSEQGSTNVVGVRRATKRPLLIEAISLPRASRDVFSRAAAIVVIEETETQPVADAGILRMVFGLTPAESRVAALVGRGESPRKTAESLGIGIETVRTLLKRVYAKTNVGRQSELAVLLASLRTRGH